jgi:uncharacterized protein (DUF362 family)
MIAMVPPPMVAIHRTTLPSLVDDLLEALTLSGCLIRIRKSRQVVLKPNLVTDKPDYIALGANTSVEFLEALLSILSDHGCQTVIAESDTGTAAKGRKLDLTWERMGLPGLASRYGAQLVNLSKESTRWVEFSGRGFKGLELPGRILDCELLIDIPKIKTHKYAVLTCAMKNLFGLVPEPRRIIYHRWLNEIIADLASLLSPQMITLVDGLIGMEGNGPLYGTPVQLDLLMASENCFAVDLVACDLIGVDPDKVRYLRISQEARALRQQTIEMVGTPLEEVRRPFQPVEFNAYRLFEKKLMESSLVHVITSEWFQRHISSHIAGLTQRLRGGGYSWYLEKQDKE